jgi:hypothetical protein
MFESPGYDSSRWNTKSVPVNRERLLQIVELLHHGTMPAAASQILNAILLVVNQLSCTDRTSTFSTGSKSRIIPTLLWLRRSLEMKVTQFAVRKCGQLLSISYAALSAASLEGHA